MSKVMLITGAGSGIGAHLVGVLAARGHLILATDINLDALSAQAKRWPQANVMVRRLDVTSAAHWAEGLAAVRERWGRLDVLLNVAGYLKPGYIYALDVQEVERHLDINLKGVILGAQAASRVMVEQGSGHIVNIGSLASLAPVPGLCLYSASKFAVRGFSLAIAQELKPKGVAVTVILPDAVETPMLTLQEDYEEAAMTFSGANPLSVDDVAAVVLAALERRPMEVALPFERATLARLANLAPELSAVIGPALVKKGRARQRKLKQRS